MLTDEALDRLVQHAEYGHLEGQDYDTAIAAAAAVRRLQAVADASQALLRTHPDDDYEAAEQRLAEALAAARMDA